MAKIFRDNFKPVEYTLIDNEGNEKTVKQIKRITPSVSNEIVKIINDPALSSGDMIVKQLTMLFGETEAFWEGFQISFLGDLLKDFAEETKKKA